MILIRTSFASKRAATDESTPPDIPITTGKKDGGVNIRDQYHQTHLCRLSLDMYEHRAHLRIGSGTV